MLYSFSKKKFLGLSDNTRAGKMAQLLKTVLESNGQEKDLEEYHQYTGWLGDNHQHTDFISGHNLDEQYHYWNGLSGHNRGLIRKTLKDCRQNVKQPLDWSVALDSLRSGYNVGSIFRTSDAFGFRKIILGGYSPGPENKSVQSAGMGAENYIEYQKTAGLSDYLRSKKNNIDGKIIGLEITDKSIPFQMHNFSSNGILVLGNEENGISKDVMEECDELVNIPMYGRKHSLNVSSAFSIIAQRIQENAITRGN